MRKNRRMPKRHSVMVGRTVQIAAVMIMLFAMVILNRLASSSCTQLTKTIREKERTLAKLEDERTRESARWDEMQTPEKLEAALLRHGLAMRYAKTELQVVRMGRDGTPVPGQLSVAKAAQRNKSVLFISTVKSCPALTAICLFNLIVSNPPCADTPF